MTSENKKDGEIKPCPFCGNAPVVHEKYRILKGIWCTCSLSSQGTNYLPPEKWNTRPIEDSLLAKNKELEEKVRVAEKGLTDIKQAQERASRSMAPYSATWNIAIYCLSYDKESEAGSVLYRVRQRAAGHVR